MKVDITDADVIGGINQANVLFILRMLGWSEVYRDPSRLAVFRKRLADDEAEVIVPLTRAAPDFVRVVGHALRIMSEVEGRSQLEIFEDIENANADLIRVQLKDPGFADGSIPVEAGRTLVGDAVDMVVAAASAAASGSQPKPLYASRKAHAVTEFMKFVRLGQTEVGSYVLKFKTMVPPMEVDLDGQHFLPDMDEPFQRRVTKRLASALSATRSSIEGVRRDGDYRSFREAVAEGVSVNLVDAITRLVTDTGAAETQISITWSPTRYEADLLAPRVSFLPLDVPFLETASRMLRELSPRPEHSLLGVVKNLHKDSEDGPGTITVEAVVDGKFRPVKITLPPEDYRKAVEAHIGWARIAASGELVKSGRSWELRDPVGFDILSNVDADDASLPTSDFEAE